MIDSGDQTPNPPQYEFELFHFTIISAAVAQSRRTSLPFPYKVEAGKEASAT